MKTPKTYTLGDLARKLPAKAAPPGSTLRLKRLPLSNVRTGDGY